MAAISPEKKAQAKARKEAAVAELMATLKEKHPHLEEAELKRLAVIEMRRKSLEVQMQRVLNPRVNSKQDTKRKILIGALVLTEAKDNANLMNLVRKLVGQLSEADQKLFEGVVPPVIQASASPAASPAPGAENIQVPHGLPPNFKPKAMSPSEVLTNVVMGKD